ncbi:MAG: hypothetical protein WD648_08100, partial [Planctomycetaceae bacterium]
LPLSFHQWTHYVSDGAADRVTIESASPASHPHATRAIGLLAILAATTIALWRCRGVCPPFRLGENGD